MDKKLLIYDILYTAEKTSNSKTSDIYEITLFRNDTVSKFEMPDHAGGGKGITTERILDILCSAIEDTENAEFYNSLKDYLKHEDVLDEDLDTEEKNILERINVFRTVFTIEEQEFLENAENYFI